ncbi:MAG TPA: hypothetical protein VMT86_03515 [Bryobacteraceae bacterium]|nr:hypothetical protein [Bryobacteraceae bacterium]
MKDSTIERKSWVAPDLSCSLLRLETRVTMLDRSNGGTNEMEVTHIAMGEPSPAYFTIPQGWTEEPPSQVKAEAAALNGIALRPGCEESGAAMDRVYNSARARRSQP